MTRACWRFLGRVPYPEALELQERVARQRAAGTRGDTLLLLEHPPTVTLGRRAREEDLLWSIEDLERSGIAVERVGRGGAATYHGPGQLVGYPIVRVGRRVRAWVEGIEGLLRDTAAAFGVETSVRQAHPGLWVGERKLASIGLEIRGGVSRHGFALNVALDADSFPGIVPCGVPGLRVTDLSRERGSRLGLAEVVVAVVRSWRMRFGTIEEETDELQRAS